MTFINERTHYHNAIFHEALNKNIKRNIHEHEYRQSRYVMSIKNNKFSKQYMDDPFKYQRSSLNIIILTVVSNVLFSKFIDVVLKLHCLLLNSNYCISVKCHTCI